MGIIFTFKVENQKSKNKPTNKRIHNYVEDMSSARHAVVKTLGLTLHDRLLSWVKEVVLKL